MECKETFSGAVGYPVKRGGAQACPDHIGGIAECAFYKNLYESIEAGL